MKRNAENSLARGAARPACVDCGGPLVDESRRPLPYWDRIAPCCTTCHNARGRADFRARLPAMVDEIVSSLNRTTAPDLAALFRMDPREGFEGPAAEAALTQWETRDVTAAVERNLAVGAPVFAGVLE